jgi:aminobenzoyl-glutamate utilization protein B
MSVRPSGITRKPALREHSSAELLADTLEKAGFTVERGLGGINTAFSAVFGSGSPRIGFLGEYDALSDMSQKAVSHREPVIEGAAGHGCGHNLLGTASLGAVLALKQRMEEQRIPGTIVYYGCPAEEIMTGKIRMAAAGCFRDLDAVLAWHPWPGNMVMTQNMLAMNTAKFTFHGTASHAAAAPERGRSALDAVELMNVGVNYLRSTCPRMCASITPSPTAAVSPIWCRQQPSPGTMSEPPNGSRWRKPLSESATSPGARP